MPVFSEKSRILVFFGDLVLFYAALYIALFIRYGFGLNESIVAIHIVPFSILFVLWVIVFIIGGLYEKHVRVQKNRLPSTIFKVEIANIIIALIFFYAIPYFGIAPKTTLLIYLVVSFVLIALWRMYGPLLFGDKVQDAIFIGSGAEFRELMVELLRHHGYPLIPKTIVDLDKQSSFDLSSISEKIIVTNLADARLVSALPRIYDMIAHGSVYVEFHRLYEDLFKRLPVSSLDERWLIENISLLPRRGYDTLKRTIDILFGGIAFIISIPFYALAYVLVKIDDRGPLFFTHERVGQDGRPIKVVKFRSMSVHNEQDGIAKGSKITRVGAFLRKSRIDELPQLWNILKGDLSLIGPRPELPSLVAIYEKEIPYYNLRHMVKPGLSGWAQINQKTPPKFMADLDATKQKVAYDLYYIKHRSFLLDILIALQTIRELLSRKGI